MTDQTTTQPVPNGRYVQVFMINDADCTTCKANTVHSFALTSKSKTMANATRVKTCETCFVTTLAPIEPVAPAPQPEGAAARRTLFGNYSPRAIDDRTSDGRRNVNGYSGI